MIMSSPDLAQCSISGLTKRAKFADSAPGQPRAHAGDDEGGELVGIGGDAERRHAPLVLTDAPQHEAEPRSHQPCAEAEIGDGDEHANEIEGGVVAQIETRQRIAAADDQAVVAAVDI